MHPREGTQAAEGAHRSLPDRRGLLWRSVAGWLPWGLWTLAMVLLGLSVALMLRNRPVSHEGFLQAFLVPGFATVGAVVAARRHNTIGWLFLGVALVAAMGAFSAEYAVRTVVAAPGSLPAGSIAAWATTWVFILNFPAVALLLLLFPDGRLLSPGWRPVAWGVWLSFGGWVLWLMVRPQPIDVVGQEVANPFAIHALGGTGIAGQALAALNVLVVVVVLLSSALAPFWRWRRAGAIERQQLRWLALVAVGIVVAGLLAAGLLTGPPVAAVVMTLVLLVLVTAGIPGAVGIAILRYRLYDIDRLISRTLTYGLLTAILGLGYAGLVLGLGQAFGGVGRQPPGWAVAGATLAVAALFQPARRRIQAVVDKRFNRRRYDAAATIAAFSGRLREQLDLDTLTAELITVVEQTMEPTTVSLWLRPPAEGPHLVSTTIDI
jgi:hypothetical protein